MLSYCGIDCSQCSIYQAAQDPEKAISLARRWKESGHEKACAEWFRCRGCHGPDELIWSDGCKIRACCRGKELENCSDCVEFPCGHVLVFEAEGGTHKAAVAELRALRQDKMNQK